MRRKLPEGVGGNEFGAGTAELMWFTGMKFETLAYEDSLVLLNSH
jgi:hypothetical protein